jgi:Na+-driven multidrug efflux pump
LNKKLNEGFVYSLKFGLLIESMLAVLIFLIAPFITMMFTTGQGSAEIASDLETFIRISVLFYPGAAFGIASSAMFQGAGKGNYALIITAIRTIILIPLIAIVFCCFFSLGLIGIWWGIVLANLLGSIIAFGCAKIFINHMFKSNGLLA